MYDFIVSPFVTYHFSIFIISTVAAFMELQNAPGGPMGLLSNPQKLQELMSDPEVGMCLGYYCCRVVSLRAV